MNVLGPMAHQAYRKLCAVKARVERGSQAARSLRPRRIT